MKHFRSDDEMLYSKKLIDLDYGDLFYNSYKSGLYMKVDFPDEFKGELVYCVDLKTGKMTRFNGYDDVLYFPNAYYSVFEVPEMLED